VIVPAESDEPSSDSWNSAQTRLEQPTVPTSLEGFVGQFTIEHDRALSSLKQNGFDAADNPEKERIFQDLVAAGFARKDGGVYHYARRNRGPKLFVFTGLVAVAAVVTCFVFLLSRKSDGLPSAARNRADEVIPSNPAKAPQSLADRAQNNPPSSELSRVQDAQTAKPVPRRSYSAEELYALVSPAVVTITVKNEAGEIIGTGSGFFLKNELVHDPEMGLRRRAADSAGKKEGKHAQLAYLLTNYHVIKSAVYGEVALSDGYKTTNFKVATEDESADLALLSVVVTSQAHVTGLPLAKHRPPVGAAVYAIGSPRGLVNSFSAGIVSGFREIEPGVKWLQTTASISPGSSGGPILTAEGEVVGVTTAARRDGQNLNFALPVSEIERFLDGAYRSRWLSDGRSIQASEDDAFISVQFEEDDSVLVLLSARDQIANNAFDGAIKALEKAKETVPPKFSYLCYFLLGKAHLGLAIKAREGTFGHAGDKYRNNPHWRAAIGEIEQALELNPNFAPSYEQLYILRWNAGQWEEARRAADSIVKLLPQCAQVYDQRGMCLIQLGRLKAALEDFQVSLKLNPKNAHALLHIGQSWSALEEYDKAVDAYNSAISMKHPEPFICHFWMGEAHGKARRYRQAIRSFEEARTLGMPAEMCNERISFYRSLIR
jgi:S1-C subfamily serine protease